MRPAPSGKRGPLTAEEQAADDAAVLREAAVAAVAGVKVPKKRGPKKSTGAAGDEDADELVARLARRPALNELRARLDRLHPADVAYILIGLIVGLIAPLVFPQLSFAQLDAVALVLIVAVYFGLTSV